MKKVVLDTSFWSKLGDMREILQLCDETGQVKGILSPVSDPESMYQFESNLSEEELLRREQEPEITTAELLAQLEKL